MAIDNERINLFSGFSLDVARGCVLCGGEEVHLRPQTYEVLKYLVENKSHLMSKDKLIEGVWKGRAVTDGALGKCIEEVREALGPEAQRYIRNVRGRGYIFDPGPEETGATEALSARLEQIDVVRVVFEDDMETNETEATARAALPPAVVVPRAGFEWRSGRNAITLAAAGLLVVTPLVIIGYRFFTSHPSNSASIKSIAVLPFQNESGNPEVEYLSDGVSESLINRISQLPGVKVIARSSSFKYKGKEVDPQEVARSLGVEAIMTGRVSQRGENLLISAELVDARDGTQVWGEQYNRKESDLLVVQAEISREIAETLRLRLTPNERQQLAKRETVNPQAYELLLKGRFSRSKGGGGKKAVEYFNQAIAVDPAYAAAYADLSATYANMITASVVDPKEFMPKAEGAAHKALDLDESLAEAHSALAGIKSIAWDWAAAEREFKRAIELNPNLAGARAMYSLYLSLMGRHDEAIAEVRRARELDPLSLRINVAVANRLSLARQNDAAIEAAKKALELDQNAPGPHTQLAYIYAAKGQYREAIAAFQEAIKLGNKSPDTQSDLGAAYANAGEREQAQAILKRLERGKEYVSPGALADLYIALGEREKAFASLERAYAEHDAQLMWLRVHPNLDPLRSDPRFQDLLRRVGLAQ